MLFTYVASGGLSAGGSTGWAATPWSYVGSGSLSLQKCGVGVVYTPKNLCFYRFNPGDTAYLGYKAAKGVLEYVVIKKVRLNSTFMSGGVGECIALYIDTFNAIYNEWDLLTLADATAMVNAYNLRIQHGQAGAECLQ